MTSLQKIILGSVVFFFLFSVSIVYAQSGSVGTQPSGSVGTQPSGSVGTTPPIVNTSSGVKILNPINVNTICGLIQKILSIVLSIGGPVAALFLAYAGFKFVFARGSPAKLTEAKKNFLYVFIGIFIFMAAWLLGQVIANTLKAIAPQTSSGGSCN